jgi:hypothetical protein
MNHEDNDVRALQIIDQSEGTEDSGPAQEGEMVDEEPEPGQDELEGEQAIVVNNRQTRHVTRDALKALRRHNHPPQLFTYGDGLGRIVGKAGQQRPELVTESRLRYRLARVANWVSMNAQGNVKGVAPPTEVVEDLLAHPEHAFPTLLGVTHAPIFRPDGSIGTRAGFDEGSGLYFSAEPKLRLSDVPARPTWDELGGAVTLIDELLHDFPFDSDASRAATWAMLLTPLVRPAIDGPLPLILLDKPKQGTGASLLADVIGLIVTGTDHGKFTAPADDSEWRKRITATLLDGPSLVTIDNVDAPLASGHLSSVLTDLVWADRILGHSRVVRLPNRALWAATGNNLRVRGDVGRRSVWCRMDAKTARPWERKPNEFLHPQLRQWVQAERGRLLAACLTIARFWWSVGCPPPAVRPLGSYEEWTRVVGGILEAAGVPCFLSNLSRFYDEADEESREWGAFLAALREKYGVEPFSTAEIVGLLLREAKTAVEEEVEQTLPEDFAPRDPGLSRKLGKAFAARVGTRYGVHCLERVGEKMRAVLWQVSCEQEDR